MRVPRRFVMPEDRSGFLAIAAWAIVVGLLLLTDPSAHSRLWLAPLWPSLQIAGGVVTLVFVTQGMRSIKMRAWATSLLVIACVGRGAALTLGLLEGTAHSWQSAVAGWGIWSFIGFLLYFTWRARVPVPGGADAGH